MEKLKKFLSDERGVAPVAAVIIFVVINMLLAMMLLYVSVIIQVIGVQSTVNQELNNLSGTISADIYNAMQEKDADEYVRLLMTDDTYRNDLRNTFLAGVDGKLTKTDYATFVYDLTFTNEPDTIVYSCNGHFTYTAHILGADMVLFDKDIAVTGRHNLKY